MRDHLTFERLEDRTLMAVNVTLNAKGILSIVGDGASDDVDVEGTGNAGEVEVFVNGGSQGTFLGVKTIRANLGAGDDGFFVAAINIGGNLDIRLGSGADEFDLDDQPTNANPDAPVFIGGSVLVNLGGNAGDFVDWDTDDSGSDFGITIGKNVNIEGVADVDLNGDGGDTAVQTDDITIGGSLKIVLNGFGDVGGDLAEVFLDDVNVGGNTTLIGTAAAETIRISDSSFVRRVEGSLGAGDDLLDIDEGAFNRFNAAVVVNFGAGFDTLDDNAGNFFAVPPIGKKGPENII
jgi:hypothetical protein